MRTVMNEQDLRGLIEDVRHGRLSRRAFTRAMIERTYALLANRPVADDDKYAEAKKLGLWVPS